jgi:hypothetical protein
MLKPLTTDEFAQWFSALDDQAAEDVATAIDVVERLGPGQIAPGSRESLLWYEHPMVSGVLPEGSLAYDLEAWGSFRDYARQILEKLESARFMARLSALGARQAAEVLRLMREIQRAADPRLRWALKLAGAPLGGMVRVLPSDASAEVRRLYFEALAAAGFKVEDVSGHSLALRELAPGRVCRSGSRRSSTFSFRLLYGVDVKRELALFVLGERLDRSYYGDSVRRAERAWQQFLEGSLGSVEALSLR